VRTVNEIDVDNQFAKDGSSEVKDTISWTNLISEQEKKESSAGHNASQLIGASHQEVDSAELSHIQLVERYMAKAKLKDEKEKVLAEQEASELFYSELEKVQDDVSRSKVDLAVSESGA